MSTNRPSWHPSAIVPSIRVHNVNRPPVLSPIGNQTVNENDTLTFTLTGSDPDGDSLTFSADFLPPGADFDSETQTFSWTPRYNATGNHRMMFTLRDNGSPQLSDSETITISVGNVNRPPVLSGIGNKTLYEAETINFTVFAPDPNNDALTISAKGLPEGADFDPDSNTFEWTPGFDDSGDYTITFTVTDNGTPAESDSETITITVNNKNRPPVLSPIGNQTVIAEAELAITLSATDPDGNDLSFAFAGLPSGAAFDPATRTLTWTPSSSQVGEHSISVIVTDNGSPERLVSETILIIVTENSETPQQSSGGGGSSSSCFILSLD